MTVLTRPRHPAIATALELAKTWCAGQIIDGAPALGHAVKVALVLDRHLRNPPPELVAAVLLHDAPYFAPLPPINLDGLLTNRLGPEVTRVVRALEREHTALATQPVPTVDTSDRWTVWASAADKIVALGSILRRAGRADDPAGYWSRRQAFVDRVPYLRAFHTDTVDLLPGGTAGELGRLVSAAERATTGPQQAQRLLGVRSHDQVDANGLGVGGVAGGGGGGRGRDHRVG